MIDALLDLVLGSSCAVCDRPGRALCPGCAERLPRRPVPAWPVPRPAGLAPPSAAGDYEGPLKLLVNAHKEHRRFALARPLGDLLAVAVQAHLGQGGRDGACLPDREHVLLVPVPSRAGVVRARGHDPLLRVAGRAAGRLRSLGAPASVGRLLRTTRAVQDQAGLGAQARAVNLAGSMACDRGDAARCLADAGRRTVVVVVVVVDDVITTGATVLEAQRALEATDIPVSGIATVAATRRTGTGPLVQGASLDRPA